MFGRATIRLGIGPHSSLLCFNVNCNTAAQLKALLEVSLSLTLMIVNYHVSFLLLAEIVNDVK